MEALPAVSLKALLQHELYAHDSLQGKLDDAFNQQRSAFDKQLAEHKHSLKPGLAHPAKEEELAALCKEEEDRSKAYADALQLYARTMMQFVCDQGPAMRVRLVKFCATLLQLQDALVLYQDLPPLQAEENINDELFSTLGRKDYKQLQRLALAQEEVELALTGDARAPAAGAKGKHTYTVRQLAARQPAAHLGLYFHNPLWQMLTPTCRM